MMAVLRCCDICGPQAAFGSLPALSTYDAAAGRAAAAPAAAAAAAARAYRSARGARARARCEPR
eukprot:COSAG01_NODE_15125_length_1371_cov_117.312893_1_plen_63_part_10